MSTLKKFLAWALMLISIIGLLVCAFGLVGTWLIQDDVTNRILTLLTRAQTSLSSVEDSLVNTDSYLDRANTAISTIRETAAQLGSSVEENTPLFDKITGVFNEELYPSIIRLKEVILPIWERVQAINNTLEALNSFPGINLPTLTPQLEALNEQILTVTATVEQLQKNIADIKTGIVENLIAPFLARLDTIATYLVQLDQNINTYLEQVNHLQAAVESSQSSIPSTITMIAILFSIFLAWAILGQISLILVLSFYLRTGKLVWKIGPADEPVEEATLKPGTL